MRDSLKRPPLLTRSLGTGDKGLSRVADLEDRGRLDVVPLLQGEGVHAATQYIVR